MRANVPYAAGAGKYDADDLPDVSGALGRRILVVEDSPSARKLLQELLLRLGVSLPDLRLAATAPEALQIFSSWQPEIAIVDLQLRTPPDSRAGSDGVANADAPKNGAELAQELLKRNPGLRVIICSASEPEGTVLDAQLKKGRVLSMVKPVFAAKVAEVLAQAAEPIPRGR